MKLILLVLLGSLILYTAALVAGNVVERRTVPVDFDQRYLPIARGILERGDFLLDGRAPSPPAYPLALAGMLKFLPDARKAAAAINVLAMSLLALLFHALVRRRLGGRIALLASLAWVTYPFGLYLAMQPGPEPLYLLALLPAVWTALEAGVARPMAALAAGVAGALPMLVKPMAIFLPLVLLGVLMFWWLRQRLTLKRFALPCSLFIAGLLTVILPWEAYLWHGTGRLIPAAETGGASVLDGWTFGLKAGAGGDLARLPGEVKTFMIEVEKISAGKGSGEVLSAVIKAAVESPGAFLKLLLIKAGRCWYGTDEMWHEGKTLAIQAFYLLLSLIGAAAWWRRGRPGGTLVAILAVLLLYHWAAATAALSILRYMVPAGFLMAVMAAFFPKAAWDKTSHEGKPG